MKGRTDMGLFAEKSHKIGHASVGIATRIVVSTTDGLSDPLASSQGEPGCPISACVIDPRNAG
jgi:hypothetical protein